MYEVDCGSQHSVLLHACCLARMQHILAAIRAAGQDCTGPVNHWQHQYTPMARQQTPGLTFSLRQCVFFILTQSARNSRCTSSHSSTAAANSRPSSSFKRSSTSPAHASCSGTHVTPATQVTQLLLVHCMHAKDKVGRSISCRRQVQCQLHQTSTDRAAHCISTITL